MMVMAQTRRSGSSSPSRSSIAEDDNEAYMRLAIQEAWKAQSVDTAYSVGAVLVKDGKVLATGYSREFPGNTHAEECAFAKLKEPGMKGIPEEFHGADLYTTLEPCSKRLSGKRPCVLRCIEAKVKRVIVGAMEPTTFVQCEGVAQLQDVGIQVEVVPNMMDECMAMNGHLEN